jgi:hypothetical protein
MVIGWMIAIYVRIHNWVIDLSHLMMHRIVAFIAMVAITVGSFKDIKHLFS